MDTTTEITQTTMAEFLAQYPVTMNLQDAPTNPNMADSHKMLNYYVTLNFEGRFMSLYYSTGIGHVETLKGEHASDVTFDKSRKEFRVHGKIVNQFPHKYRIRKPKVADILDCLASDSSGIDEDFEDWCSNYGYDTDSRSAEATYRLCQTQARELRILLGRAAYSELLNCERL